MLLSQQHQCRTYSPPTHHLLFIRPPLLLLLFLLFLHHAPERVRAVPVPAAPLRPPPDVSGLQERRHGAPVPASRQRAGTGGPEQRDPEPSPDRRESSGRRRERQRRAKPDRLQRAEVHQVHLRRPLHQHQPHQGAGVRRRVPPGSDAPELDRRRLQQEAVGSPERQQPRLAVRQRQDPHAAHPAAVPGRQHENVQNHRGHLVQVQEVLEAAQRVREQVRGAGRSVAAAAPAQAQGQEQEEAREEPAQRQLARHRTLRLALNPHAGVLSR